MKLGLSLGLGIVAVGSLGCSGNVVTGANSNDAGLPFALISNFEDQAQPPSVAKVVNPQTHQTRSGHWAGVTSTGSTDPTMKLGYYQDSPGHDGQYVLGATGGGDLRLSITDVAGAISFNASMCTGIQFYAKTSANDDPASYTFAATDRDSSARGTYSTNLTVTSTWQQFTVLWSELTLPASDAGTADASDAASDSATGSTIPAAPLQTKAFLSFDFISPQMSFWIDDVYLTGCTVSAETGAPDVPVVVDGAPATAGLHVVGNQIVDPNGDNIVVHGVDRPTMEQYPNGVDISLSDFQNMASWNAKVVRIATSQCLWFDDTTGTGYQANLAQAVSWAEAAGLYVILDLHWSDPPENTAAPDACGQQPMADTNSLVFWQQAAATFANDPKVSFELYNEPFLGGWSNVSAYWDIWQNGGSYNASGNTQANGYKGTYQAVGMQQLYDAVRGTGANNMVIIGGLNWAYDLSGVPTHLINGTNIAYATHPYSFKEGSATYTVGGPAPANWDTMFGNLAATYPVIATEFGDNDCTTPYYSVFTSYAASKGISWTAWAWYWGGWPDANSGSACSYPTILSDWNGDPSNVGQVVKSAM